MGQYGQYWTAGWVGYPPFCIKAYLRDSDSTQNGWHQVSKQPNGKQWYNLFYSLFLYLKMPLSCGPCINMALRSEAWALTFAFTSLPECLLVCRIVRLFLCSCCAGLCVSAATYLWRKYILPAFGNSHFLQPPSLWQLAPFPGIRVWTINPSTLLSP